MNKIVVLIAAILLSQSVEAQTPLWLRTLLMRLAPSDLLKPAEKTQTEQSPTVQREVEQLFATSACDLPQVLKDQFGKQIFLPEELRTGLATQQLGNATAQKVAGVGIRGVLHTLSVADPTRPNEPPKHLRLVNSSTYNSVDPSLLIDSNADNLVFTLDCTGYLNAALSVAGNVPATQLQSATKLARNSSRSIMIVRARVFSPVAIAMNPSLAPANYPMAAATRIDLLFSAASEVAQVAFDVNDSTPVVSWRQQDLLWMSNSGSSALQGNGTFSTSVNAGLGVVSFQGSVDAGIRTSREVRFAAFSTYVLNQATLEPVTKTYGALRDELTHIILQSRPYSRDRLEDGAGQRIVRYFYSNISRRICELNWSAEQLPDQNASPGAISSDWNQSTGICTISFFPSGQGATGQMLIAAPSALPAPTKHYFKLSLQLP